MQQTPQQPSPNNAVEYQTPLVDEQPLRQLTVIEDAIRSRAKNSAETQNRERADDDLLKLVEVKMENGVSLAEAARILTSA